MIFTDLDPKVGYNIGWDYYAHDLALPRYIATDKDSKSIVDGFNEAKNRKLTKQTHDRFVRKWLGLRINAWRRHRFVDDSVTPSLLRFIDTTHCPVTGELLTHGTDSMSDWSVDRVNNDAAYTSGNLIVVSSHANIAKSNYSHLEILDFAYDEDVALPTAADILTSGVTPLTRLQWAAWALICSHAPVEDHGNSVSLSYISPCVIPPPPGLYSRPASYVQLFIAKKAAHADNGEFKKLLSLIAKPKRKQLNELVKRAEKSAAFGLAVWFDRRLFLMFLEFYDSLTSAECKSIYSLAHKSCRTETMEVGRTDYHFDSKGFTEHLGMWPGLVDPVPPILIPAEAGVDTAVVKDTIHV